MSAPGSDARPSDAIAADAVAGAASPWLFFREPLGLLGFALVLLVIFLGVFADWVVPFDPFAISLADSFLGPSHIHLLGTDQLGRDVLSRVIKGSQIAIFVGLTSIVIALLLGLVIGLVAGYGGRRLDNALLIVMDTIYSFPTVMLALALITLLGNSLLTLILVVVVIQTPAYGRLVRSSTLTAKTSLYVAAERAMGAGTIRILARHILPNIIGPVVIVASMDIPAVIALEAGLSFLGLGTPPPAPSWGRILSEGYQSIREAPWIVIGGGLPLIVTTLGFTFLGEALRDFLDPKLRRMI